MRYSLHMNIQTHKKQRQNFLHPVDKDEFLEKNISFPINTKPTFKIY